MSTYARTSLRTPLRATIAVAALAGALLTPAAAFAATPAAAPCHVTKTVVSQLPDTTVVLSNDLAKGPKAELLDTKGAVLATVDRAHPMDYGHGIRLEEGTDGKVTFFQRTETGDKSWKAQPFPALPASCLVSGTYKLVDGEKVEVTRTAQGRYRADLASSGRTVLRTEGQDVDGFYGGMHLTLNASTGAVLSEYTATRSGCTVTLVVSSVYGAGDSVKLTNSPQGPKAVLRDTRFKTVSTVDRAHPNDKALGVIIDGANTSTPRLGQRTQGGTPYGYTAFPKLPAGCVNTTPAKTAASLPAANTPAQNAGQTTVVPKGAVAAGAEFQQDGNDKGVLIGGAAAVAAAGAVGFVAVRRRSAARI
ncbi:hypothetical protein [Streptomyces sp. NBC_00083]|uniref:hypothetical protein n=1 Tax=Streptomyces sp. NBC_00083 TaxID=2975647 RepID=UPI00224EFA7D|nr:hypothetical protein [Streptomyces sp. NBC_00083]MCX5385243.1 hypothetical protein [Streptomyces sp. NBC_00083]